MVAGFRNADGSPFGFSKLATHSCVRKMRENHNGVSTKCFLVENERQKLEHYVYDKRSNTLLRNKVSSMSFYVII